MPEDIPTLRAYTIDGERLPRADGRAGADDYYPGDVAFTDDGRLLMVVSEWVGTTRRPSRPPAAGRPGNGHRHHAEDVREIRIPVTGSPTSRQPSPTTPPRWSPGPATTVARTGCRWAAGARSGSDSSRGPPPAWSSSHTDGRAPVLVGRGGHALRRPRTRGAGAGRAPGSRAGRDGAARRTGGGHRWARVARWSCGRSTRGPVTGRSGSPWSATPERPCRWRCPPTAGRCSPPPGTGS